MEASWRKPKGPNGYIIAYTEGKVFQGPLITVGRHFLRQIVATPQNLQYKKQCFSQFYPLALYSEKCYGS